VERLKESVIVFAWNPYVVLIAIEKKPPASAFVHVVKVPTCTGEELLVASPKPSSPEVFNPHVNN
jgi:hypothetical protein